jgi:enoyl-CoA hydratase
MTQTTENTDTSLDGYSHYQTLRFERPSDGVLLVRLNRPQALNAMTYAMHTELAGLWPDIAKDRATRVVVVTGEGRGFSAGNDLKQPDPSFEKTMEIMEEARQIVYGMLNLDKPIVAAINGAAVGAGLAVALMSDITVAAEDAILNDGHTRVGVAAGDHAAIIWPLLCGMAKAKYYLMLCEHIDGREAERIGLVSKALPTAEVLDEALAIAQRLAMGSQQAIQWTKRSLNHWMKQAAPIFELSGALEMLGFNGADVHEARTAFRDGRTPQFPSAQSN